MKTRPADTEAAWDRSVTETFSRGSVEVRQNLPLPVIVVMVVARSQEPEVNG